MTNKEASPGVLAELNILRSKDFENKKTISALKEKIYTLEKLLNNTKKENRETSK